MTFRGKYYWASNFASSPIHYKIKGDIEETIFPTAEHLYQALKYVDRPELMKEISLLPTPVEAKRYGKIIPAIADHTTPAYRLKIMQEVIDLKYKLPLFKAFLLSTNDIELRHDNLHGDVFFGAVDGVGQNHLGLMLMDKRDDLKNEILYDPSYTTQERINDSSKENTILKELKPLTPKTATLRIAGIGSRNLPDNIEEKIKSIVYDLAIFTNGKIKTHTGDADGSDSAFKKYAIENNLECISYIPFKGFNNSTSSLYTVCNKAKTLASFHHPYFDKMKFTTQCLMGRNVYQVMSDTFDNWVDCVICYTPDGVEKAKDVVVGKTGGTGLAISLADTLGIPVFNLANDDAIDRIYDYYEVYRSMYVVNSVNKIIDDDGVVFKEFGVI